MLGVLVLLVTVGGSQATPYNQGLQMSQYPSYSAPTWNDMRFRDSNKETEDQLKELGLPSPVISEIFGRSPGVGCSDRFTPNSYSPQTQSSQYSCRNQNYHSGRNIQRGFEQETPQFDENPFGLFYKITQLNQKANSRRPESRKQKENFRASSSQAPDSLEEFSRLNKQLISDIARSLLLRKRNECVNVSPKNDPEKYVCCSTTVCPPLTTCEPECTVCTVPDSSSSQPTVVPCHHIQSLIDNLCKPITCLLLCPGQPPYQCQLSPADETGSYPILTFPHHEDNLETPHFIPPISKPVENSPTHVPEQSVNSNNPHRTVDEGTSGYRNQQHVAQTFSSDRGHNTATGAPEYNGNKQMEQTGDYRPVGKNVQGHNSKEQLANLSLQDSSHVYRIAKKEEVQQVTYPESDSDINNSIHTAERGENTNRGEEPSLDESATDWY